MSRTAVVAAALALAVLAQGAASAQADPIEALKAGGLPQMSLEQAYAALVAQGAGALPRLSQALVESGARDVQRLRVAIVLAEMANTDAGAELKRDLLQCTKDGNPGVRYWGLIGVGRHRGVTDAELGKVLEGYLVAGQPRLLQVVAADLAGQRRVKAVVPWLVALLQARQPPMIEARQKKVKEFLATPLTATTARDTRMVPPEEMMAPTMRGMGGGSPWEEEGAMDYPGPRDRPRMAPAVPRPTPGVPAPMAPTLPAAPTVPGAPGTRPAEPRIDLVLLVDRMKQSPQEQVRLRELARALEEVEEIFDIRRFGVALQTIVADDLTEAQRAETQRDFLRTPPWEIERAVALWTGWFEENRAKYPGGPSEQKPED